MDNDIEARFQRIEALIEQSAKDHAEFKADILTLEQDTMQLQQDIVKTSKSLDRLIERLHRNGGRP